VKRIIEPLGSRCIKFQFKPIPLKAQLSKLTEICQMEKVTCEPQTLHKIIEISEGDLRKSITMIQSCATLNNNTLTLKEIIDSSGLIPD